MKNNNGEVNLLILKNIFFLNTLIIALSLYVSPSLSKEYIKYENCRLRKTEINIKDGVKDGYKCIFKRQGKGKDVTVFQPSPICQKSFKCKTETQ